MSEALTSSYPSYGANVQMNSGRVRTHSPYDAHYLLAHGDGNGTSLPLVQPFDEVQLGADKTAIELAIRQAIKEIHQAKQELRELEETLLREQLTPPAREWLFPLMAIGLAMSLYGSFSASNTAELGATGLMLLWSLTAFWYIHMGDRQLEQAKNANRAEMEIWTNRIAELQQALEQNQQIVETMG